ncbi:MAG: hypothetical protein ABJA61_03820 [Caldimonas sp.]
MSRAARAIPTALGIVVAATAALGVESALATPHLDFEQAFSARAEPARLHYRASYSLNERWHDVEVWRDSDRRLRRRTDDAIDTYVFRPRGEVEWQMVVLDLRRRIRTDVDRTNLYRIGHFTDWFGLAHSLSRPVGAYQVAAIARPRTDARPIASCRWYALTRGDVGSVICWSKARGLPLLIADAEGRVQWRVRALDTAPLAKDAFAISDAGFVRNDANQDIHAD